MDDVVRIIDSEEHDVVRVADYSGTGGIGHVDLKVIKATKVSKDPKAFKVNVVQKAR